MHRPLAAAAAALVAAIYILRLDSVVGLIVDDGWYVVLAQALSRGDGYTMINAPVRGIVPIDPPGFPALLSLVFRLAPAFPDNLIALKSISVAAMFAVGAVTRHYLRRYRGLDDGRALAVAVATALTPAFVFLATSAVMSECVFTLCLVLATLFIDRAAEQEAGSRVRDTSVAGLLSAAAMMVRSAGVAVPAAGFLFLLYRRRWKSAAGFAAVVAIGLSPWLLYSRAHRPSDEQQAAHGGAHTLTYRDTFWQRWAGDPALGTVTVGEIPGRVADNLVDVFGRAVGGVVAPVIFRGPDESGQEIVALGGARGFRRGSMGGARSAMAIAFAISAVCAIGFAGALLRRPRFPEFLVPVALAVVVLWPHWTFRFVLPLAPFLFFYFSAGSELLGAVFRLKAEATGRSSVRISRLALACVIGLLVLEHSQYLFLKGWRTDQVGWISEAREADEVLGWMRQSIPAGTVVATTNPPLVFLKTGLQTVAIDDPGANWGRWQRLGVRHLAALRPSDLPDPALGYSLRHRSSRGLWVLEMKLN